MNDRFETLVDLFEQATTRFAARPYLGTKTPLGWQWRSYAEVRSDVDAFRGGLAKLGVRANDRVAIICNNRVEWVVAAHASYGLGAVVVPMYEAQAKSEWAFVLRDSGARVVVAGTPLIFDALLELKPELPELEHLVGLALPKQDSRSYPYVLTLGREHPMPIQRPSAGETAGYLYTSGTTGEPKGVVLSHGNIVSNVRELQKLYPLDCTDRSLAFLPWAHAFGQTCELHMFTSVGAAIALNDEIPNLLGNLKEVEPTVLIAVPRIFNRIYAGVNQQMDKRPKAVRWLFQRAVALSAERLRGRPLRKRERALLALADRLVFAKIRERLGKQLRFSVSGSAALGKDVLEFVTALGIDVYEGYGLTETSPVVTVNCPGHRKLGSVGFPLPGVRVVIDASAGESSNDGEIVVHGPCVMQRYHQRPEETARVLTPEHGLRTGDLGHLDTDGYLYITGRIKEQYKLENGKYVLPTQLEEQLKVSPFIANVMLFGDNRPHNVALVVIDVAAVDRWAAARGHTLKDATKDTQVRELIQEEIARCSSGFRSYERPLGIFLITEDFTTENGMLTPSLKLKRRNVLQKYGDLLKALYVRP